jgi:hypothetical protein
VNYLARLIEANPVAKIVATETDQRNPQTGRAEISYLHRLLLK